MKTARTINEAIRFLLELCMLAAFAYWGSTTGGSTAVNVPLELLLFALAAAALAAAGATTLAVIFAVAAAVNTLLLHAGSGEI